MAITRAQQARQMYKKGSKKPAMQGGGPNYLGKQPEVTVPKKWKSSPDHPDTELAYITEPEKQVLIALNMHGGLEDGKPNKGPKGIISLQGDMGSVKSDGKGGFKGDGKGPDPEPPPAVKAAMALGKPTSVVTKDDEKKAKEEAKQFFKKKGITTASGGNFLKNILKSRQKNLYNVFPNNPKRELEFLSSLRITNPAKYNTLPQNLKDLLESTDQDFAPSYEDSPKLSFEDFEALTEFDDGAFAQYAKDRGSPGLSVSGDMSQVGIKSVRRDEFGNPVKDMFGNTLFDYGPPQDRGGDDGPSGESDLERKLRLLEEQNAALKNQQNTDDEDPTGGMAFRFMNRGGMPMDAPTTGGIMDLETGRQMYFLGKLVKKATRAVKKIVKSPVGKAAIGLAALKFGPGLLAKDSAFAKFMLADPSKGFSLGNLIGKNLTTKGAMAGIAALSATPLLFGEQEEDDEEDIDRGPGLDIAYIRNNPYTFIPRRFAAEGGSMKEPVAKKTMPLIDMDGKEKDYRETGGFVDMGRMERADDVPARLSKNEFVFTADAVRNAGDGSVDKGAEVMYNMMKNLESGGEVSEESQGLEGARKMFQTSQRLEEVL